MAESRELARSELKEIYQIHMREDFPPMELRPWFAIERAMEDGGYSAYGYFEAERLLAYATLFSPGEEACALLDHFAVVAELRGRGIGTAFLRELRSLLPEVDGLFIESERADSAKSGEERELRRRRIAFYQAVGAVPTGMNCRLFHVEYQLLYLPVAREAPDTEAFPDAICRLYRELYGTFFGRLCRPYREDEGRQGATE